MTKPTDRIAAAKRFAIEAARLAANTRCRDVAILNVTNLSDVCDFFVLATGTSPRQMRSVADEVVELAETQAFAPLNKPESESGTWILVDCIDVIVHVFSDDGRRYYDLDNLWGDAKRVDWEQK